MTIRAKLSLLRRSDREAPAVEPMPEFGFVPHTEQAQLCFGSFPTRWRKKYHAERCWVFECIRGELQKGLGLRYKLVTAQEVYFAS